MNPVQPITVSRHSSPEERRFALTQIYRQVLERQPYAYERQLLAQIEKNFVKDKIGVRRFLKEFGQSEVFLQAFYHHSSNLKFLDWCFKKFMGRAPMNQEEIQLYCDILMKQGVSQLVTAILDSEEYRKAFGCFTVPYTREQKYYASPKAYLESQFLNHEHLGQRGWSVPTLYWHQLGLNCNGGVCRHPEADEVLEPMRPQREDEELWDLFKLFESSEPGQAQVALSSEQRRALRQAML